MDGVFQFMLLATSTVTWMQSVKSNMKRYPSCLCTQYMQCVQVYLLHCLYTPLTTHHSVACLHAADTRSLSTDIHSSRYVGMDMRPLAPSNSAPLCMCVCVPMNAHSLSPAPQPSLVHALRVASSCFCPKSSYAVFDKVTVMWVPSNRMETVCVKCTIQMILCFKGILAIHP